MTIDEMIEVLQAYKNDDELEVNTDCGWKTAPLHPMWNFEKYDYRVKPKPREVYITVYNTNIQHGGVYNTRETATNWLNEGGKVVKFIEAIE